MAAKLPPLESLRILETCVRHENMTRAASEIGITPAAVSLRMRNLEAELRTPLFIRSGPRIRATPACRALADQIQGALGSIAQAVEACRAARSQIRVTAVPTVASRWLAAALTDYHRSNPAIEVLVDSTDEVRPPGSFDLAVKCGQGRWKGLRAHQIFPSEATPMVAAGLAGSVRTPADLEQVTLVPDVRWAAWFSPFGLSVERMRFTAEYPSQELAAAAVLAGAGAALLSPSLFAGLLADGRLARPFDAVVNDGNAYFLTIGQEEQRPEVLELRDFLLSHASSLERPSGSIEANDSWRELRAAS